jgi:hypothetical protein
MPQIIVTAGDAADLTDRTVILRERITAGDFESDRFAANLIERLGWAVSDAIEVEERDCSAHDERGGSADGEAGQPEVRELIKA